MNGINRNDMINIAICDDERAEIACLAALVRKWAAALGVAVRLTEFESAESFLFTYEDDKTVDILLLDIQMKEMDGVELARQIRRRDEIVQIIFITGYPDFYAEGYDVSALHYLMKPVKEEKLFEVLGKAAERLAKSNMINKMSDYSNNDFAQSETLNRVLSKMLKVSVIGADCHAKRLHGGTVGEVLLIEGTAVTVGGESLPFRVALKIQRKWERHGDPGSWRREYDLYTSGFGALFTDSLRWPECYHAEMNADETEWQIWMEYIDGASGHDLTPDMFERAAFELGRWQGKLYARRYAALMGLRNLSKAGDLKGYYLHCRSSDKVYNYIRSTECKIPKHLCQMLIENDENSDEVWARIEALPIVFCHRDFWVTNIFYEDGRIILIDWDTAGWGYLGEDIKSLIADEADVNHMVEYYRRCVPAYYGGFSEYADVSQIADDCVYEMILVNIGYRLVEWFLDAGTPERKALQIATLQKIYEMKTSRQ